MNLSKLTTRLAAATALVAATAAVPAPDTNTLRLRVRLNSAQGDCVCPVNSRVTVTGAGVPSGGYYLAERDANGQWILIASMTPGTISERSGRCHSLPYCSAAEIPCQATVSVRVAVHAMGTHPGNVFFLSGTPPLPMGVGNVERVQLTSINECGRSTTATTSLAEMDPATGNPSNRVILSTALDSACGTCNG